MLESTIRLVPEPALRTPGSGLERPETALLAFSSDMAETWQLGDVLGDELEEQGIIYDPHPDQVPNFYTHGIGNSAILGTREVSQLVLNESWSGKDIADNLLKGMYWARLESKAPGLIDLEQARIIGSAVGAVYNMQHGLWGKDYGDEPDHTILMHSYVDGHRRLLVRGSDTGIECNKDMIDARTALRLGIDKPLRTNEVNSEGQDTEAIVFPGRFAGRARAIGGRMAAAAASIVS